MDILLLSRVWEPSVSREKFTSIYTSREGVISLSIEQINKYFFYCAHQLAFTLKLNNHLPKGT